MVETEKVNKSLPNIPTDNAHDLNQLNYTESILIGDKNLTIQLEEINQNILAKEGRLNSCRDRVKQF